MRKFIIFFLLLTVSHIQAFSQLELCYYEAEHDNPVINSKFTALIRQTILNSEKGNEIFKRLLNCDTDMNISAFFCKNDDLFLATNDNRQETKRLLLELKLANDTLAAGQHTIFCPLDIRPDLKGQQSESRLEETAQDVMIQNVNDFFINDMWKLTAQFCASGAEIERIYYIEQTKFYRINFVLNDFIHDDECIQPGMNSEQAQIIELIGKIRQKEPLSEEEIISLIEYVSERDCRVISSSHEPDAYYKVPFTYRRPRVEKTYINEWGISTLQ